MSTDLIAELRAALDEDEAVVRRNSDGRGLDGGFPDYRTYVDEDTSAADAYIDRFNPARVLADIAAKRKLIARGGPFCTSNCGDPGNAPMDPDTDWTTPLEHHLDCGAYEAAQAFAEAYGIRPEGGHHVSGPQRIAITYEQAARYFRAHREYGEEFHRRKLHYLVKPDPADLPPQPPCPHCGAGVESSSASLVADSAEPDATMTALLDVEPCGHRLTANPCDLDLFDA